MERFIIEDLYLTGLKKITRIMLGDDRGFFTKIFSEEELRYIGWNRTIKQVNHTFSKSKGTIRGMHFQYPPHAEMKLVSCLHGEIWDVVVDLRKESPTFLKWQAVNLSSENLSALFIPEGLAHGFQTLTDNCELLYLHSENYYADFEGAIRYNDPTIGIHWPIEVSNISIRDQNHPLITPNFKGIL